MTMVTDVTVLTLMTGEVHDLCVSVLTVMSVTPIYGLVPPMSARWVMSSATVISVMSVMFRMIVMSAMSMIALMTMLSVMFVNSCFPWWL